MLSCLTIFNFQEDFAYEVLLAQKRVVKSFNSPNTPKSGVSSAVASRKGSVHLVQQTPPAGGSASSFFGENETAPTSTRKKKSGSGTPRAKKDPEAPRKPVNAYFIFCERKRTEVQKQMQEEKQGDVDRKEVTRKLSQLWLDLPPDEKKMYYTLYEIEKTRYDAEMKEYSANRALSLSNSGSSTPGFPPGPNNPDQPPTKKARRADKGSRNGPGRPGSWCKNTPSSDLSNDCNSSSNCLPSDNILPSTLSEDTINLDESVNSQQLQASAEDVFESLEEPASSLLTSTCNDPQTTEEHGVNGEHGSLKNSPKLHSTDGESVLPLSQGIVIDKETLEQAHHSPDDWRSDIPAVETNVPIEPEINTVDSKPTAIGSESGIESGEEPKVVPNDNPTSQQMESEPILNGHHKQEDIETIEESSDNNHVNNNSNNHDDIPKEEAVKMDLIKVSDIPLPPDPPSNLCHEAADREHEANKVIAQPPPPPTC